QRTRQAFLDLAGHEPGRFRVIDAAWPIEAVWEHIKADVDAVLADAAADERAAAQAAAAQAAVTKESDGNTPAGGAR
ncbi:dTMP kinase, partial [Bifidobacterium bifidum]